MPSKRRTIIVQNERNNGVQPHQVKNTPSTHRVINGRKKKIYKNLVVQNKPGSKPRKERDPIPRPQKKLLIDITKDDNTRIGFPEKGSFNPGIVPFNNGYIMVYRPDEHRFIACILDKNLKPDPKSYFKFKISNCADPRLVWFGKKLLMVYSSTTGVGMNYECIRGSVIMDLDVSQEFIDADPFRISPENLKTRQKNWTPFVHDEKCYLVASICPHIIYELKDDLNCEQKFETQWLNPWFYPDFLRGNTNPVLLEDGNYLSTFHTAVWNDNRCHYDNGCYVFEGKPPFKVLKCSNRTYLPAEGAIEPHFRNGRTIVCTFPVGMIREDKNILISYGDNDSCVRVTRTTVNQMLDLMVDVYN